VGAGAPCAGGALFAGGWFGVWRAPQEPQKAEPAGRGWPQLVQNVDCIEGFLRTCVQEAGLRQPAVLLGFFRENALQLAFSPMGSSVDEFPCAVEMRPCLVLLLRAYYNTVVAAFL
jgi:hypothetical protein